jgi:hypothetical protein
MTAIGLDFLDFSLEIPVFLGFSLVDSSHFLGILCSNQLNSVLD